MPLRRFRPASGPSVAVIAVLVALAGCAHAPAPDVSRVERFETTSPYAQRFPVRAALACDAARRALLGQGYRVDGTGEVLQGDKRFEPSTGAHVRITFHVVCAADDVSGRTSTVFVNAVQEAYALKTVASYASIGVSVLGSVSLPVGSNYDSLVKVGSETVREPTFYGRFFELVERVLAERVDDDDA